MDLEGQLTEVRLGDVVGADDGTSLNLLDVVLVGTVERNPVDVRQFTFESDVTGLVVNLDGVGLVEDGGEFHLDTITGVFEQEEVRYPLGERRTVVVGLRDELVTDTVGDGRHTRGGERGVREGGSQFQLFGVLTSYLDLRGVGVDVTDSDGHVRTTVVDSMVYQRSDQRR